jgi:DNA-binding MarR family transcriptional regulator
MSKSHEQLASELTIAAARLVRWLRASDTAPQLTRQQTSAMAAIVHSGGISPSALAELERIHRPTMTRVIAELAERGLIVRERNPADARSAVLKATPAGQKLWEEGQVRTVAPLARRIAAMPPPDRRLIKGMIEMLERLVDAAAEEPPG